MGAAMTADGCDPEITAMGFTALTHILFIKLNLRVVMLRIQIQN